MPFAKSLHAEYFCTSDILLSVSILRIVMLSVAALRAGMLCVVMQSVAIRELTCRMSEY
jgi:hypothetical protein